jgi:hypothetical protein
MEFGQATSPHGCWSQLRRWRLSGLRGGGGTPIEITHLPSLSRQGACAVRVR